MNVAFKFLKKGAYTQAEMSQIISQTEFKQYDIKEEGISLFIYLKK